MPRMIADHRSRKRTMSCVESRTKGVLSECERAVGKDLLASSRGDLYLVSPVSFRFLDDQR